MLFVPLEKHSFCRVFDVLLIETFQKHYLRLIQPDIKSIP